MVTARNGVLISHISEESAVALVIQGYLKAAFGKDFPVFVSTDKISIEPGEQWYETIIDKLSSVEVVIVLLSQESCRRPWINFEAGCGVGGVVKVLPLVLSRFKATQVPFPLAGLQVLGVDDVGLVVDAVRLATKRKPAIINNETFALQITEAENSLNYKSLQVIPTLADKAVQFHIKNVGNVDLELLMLEVLIPDEVIASDSNVGHTGIEQRTVQLDDMPYRWHACYSSRGAPFTVAPLLRPILTPSMGAFRVPAAFHLKPQFNRIALRELFLFVHIHAAGFNTALEAFDMSKLPIDIT